MRWEELDAADVLVHLRDVRFALDDGAVVHDSVEAHVLLRSRQDLTLDGQDLRRLAQGRLDIARDLRHRCDEEVAEGVAGKLALAFEAILEELLHQRLGIGQRDETVAQVARRDDAEVLAQPAGRAAIIGDRHDSRNVRVAALMPRRSTERPWPPPMTAMFGPLPRRRFS